MMDEIPPEYAKCKWIRKDETQCQREAKEDGSCAQHMYSERLYQHSLVMETRCNSWAERNGINIRYKVVDSRNMTGNMTPEELMNEIGIAEELCENIKI